jgi:hypothetical protein
LRSSAANLTGLNILLPRLAIAGDVKLNGAAILSCLSDRAEIAVMFPTFDGWVRSTAGSTLFLRAGAAGGACLRGESGEMADLPVPRYSMSLFKRIDFATLLAELESWSCLARPNQLPPPGEDWFIWLLLAGRGFGKT